MTLCEVKSGICMLGSLSQAAVNVFAAAIIYKDIDYFSIFKHDDVYAVCPKFIQGRPEWQ